MEKVLEALAGYTSLKDALKASIGIEEIFPPMTPDSIVRCSSISGICAREEILRSRLDRVRRKVIGPGLLLSMKNGHAIHDMIQNDLLPATGFLEGQWECQQCRALHLNTEGKTISDQAIPRPKACWCGSETFKYIEFEVTSEIHGSMRIKGHMDGVLRIPGFSGKGLLEAKSIAQEHAWKIASFPMYEHVIQANMYMGLAGLRWAVIFYWIKDMTGMECIVDHKIEYDPTLTLSIVDTLKALRFGLENPHTPLPDRICAVAECDRAKECTTAKECFELP